MRKVALVSGGGRGIGRAICLALADAGHDVAVNFRRDAGAAEATAIDVESRGQRALAVQASVDDPDACAEMVSSVVQALGAPSTLVHNGGIASRGNPVAATDLDELDRVMRTHAYGAFHLAKLCIPHLTRHERSDIVMISSVATDTFAANGGPYNMAKAALEALAMTLGNELRDAGVHVNIVAPGLVATDMGDRMARAASGGQAAMASDLDDTAPFGHVCQPEEIADVVDFLVSNAARYVTGVRIRVDGNGFPAAGYSSSPSGTATSF